MWISFLLWYVTLNNTVLGILTFSDMLRNMMAHCFLPGKEFRPLKGNFLWPFANLFYSCLVWTSKSILESHFCFSIHISSIRQEKVINALSFQGRFEQLHSIYQYVNESMRAKVRFQELACIFWTIYSSTVYVTVM